MPQSKNFFENMVGKGDANNPMKANAFNLDNVKILSSCKGLILGQTH